MQNLAIDAFVSGSVECVAPETPLPEILRRLSQSRVGCVTVCEKETPLGVISEGDLVRALASGEGAHSRTARDLMSSPAITIGLGTAVVDAIGTMRQSDVRRLPVVDGEGRLVGVVTQSELLGAQSRELEQLHQRLEQKVTERTQELLDVVQRLEALTLQDGLLEIGNRRAMQAVLDKAHETALRYQRVYSILLFDVDLFKAYNDRYGHTEGDLTLKRIATSLRNSLRRADSLFRYGGEEILVFLPETDGEGARETAERLREAVEQRSLPHAGSPFGSVTVSCGVATLDARQGRTWVASWQDVVARADRALYAAKEAGRNRVELADSDV